MGRKLAEPQRTGNEQRTPGAERGGHRSSSRAESTRFHDQFTALFEDHFARLVRVLDRMSGEPELAKDLAQEAFVRLYRRGSLPDSPASWLIAVALNLFRNTKTMRSRRGQLLSVARGVAVLADPPASPAEALESRESTQRVRSALDRLAERDRRMLLLHAEGYRYREIAAALGLNETSIGTLLARARRAFLQAHAEADHADHAP